MGRYFTKKRTNATESVHKNVPGKDSRLPEGLNFVAHTVGVKF